MKMKCLSIVYGRKTLLRNRMHLTSGRIHLILLGIMILMQEGRCLSLSDIDKQHFHYSAFKILISKVQNDTNSTLEWVIDSCVHGNGNLRLSDKGLLKEVKVLKHSMGHALFYIPMLVSTTG